MVQISNDVSVDVNLDFLKFERFFFFSSNRCFLPGRLYLNQAVAVIAFVTWLYDFKGWKACHAQLFSGKG